MHSPSMVHVYNSLNIDQKQYYQAKTKTVLLCKFSKQNAIITNAQLIVTMQTELSMFWLYACLVAKTAQQYIETSIIQSTTAN